MSIATTDLAPFCSASMPSDDTSTSGGAIDVLRRPDFTQMSQTEKVRVTSSNAGDTTQTATCTGRKADGSVVTETLSLNGTANVDTTNNYERLLKVELSASAAGTVSVKGVTSASTFRTIPAGERGFMAPFRQLASDPSVQKDFYVKIHWKNLHGTLALTSSVVKENADPDNRITHALAAALDDSGSVANRVTSPGLTFSNADKSVPNSGNLSAGSAVGLWLNLTLPAGDPAHRTSYVTELDGQTT